MMCIKLLRSIVGIFILLSVPFVTAQKVTSNYFGFHTELVRANATTPLCPNVTHLPHGSLTQTIEELFGPNNEIGLKEGSIEEGDPDIVWVENEGEWLQIYYDGWWRSVEFGDEDMFNLRIKNSNFSIESHKDTDWYIVFSGYVSQKAMVYEVYTGYHVLNRGCPLPIRLDQSGISASSGFRWGNEKTADIVYIFNGEAYEGYYYSGKGWKKLGTDKGYFGDVYLSSSLAIDIKGKEARIVIRPPTPLRRSKLAPKVHPTIKPPPKPYIYTSIGISGAGNPLFYAQWYAHNHKVWYTTEIFDPTIQDDWFSVGLQASFPSLANPQILSVSASLLSLRQGVGRVVAEWEPHPSKKIK